MEKILLKCDICGGDLLILGDGDYAKCENCSAKYGIERLKKKYQEIRGIVQVEGIANFDNLVERADGYYYEGEWNKALDYYNKALDLKPKDEYCKQRIRVIETEKHDYPQSGRCYTGIIKKVQEKSSLYVTLFAVQTTEIIQLHYKGRNFKEGDIVIGLMMKSNATGQHQLDIENVTYTDIMKTYGEYAFNCPFVREKKRWSEKIEKADVVGELQKLNTLGEITHFISDLSKNGQIDIGDDILKFIQEQQLAEKWYGRRSELQIQQIRQRIIKMLHAPMM